MQKTLLTPRSQIDFFDFEWQPWVLMRSCWPCPQQIAGAEKNGAPGVLAPFRNAATVRVKGAFFLFVFLQCRRPRDFKPRPRAAQPPAAWVPKREKIEDEGLPLF